MKSRIPVLALVVAFAVSACSPDNVVTPLKVPSSPNLAKSAGPSSGKYVVMTAPGRLPANFAQTVASLGGTLTAAHAGAGFATVSGLTADAANQLATTAGVTEVDPDEIVSLEQPTAPIRADAAALAAGPSIESATNPATAILASWQWNMALINADKAWAAGKLGSSTVTVAILDTGIDYDNRDLNGLVDLSRSVSFMNVYVPDSTETRLPDDAITTTFFPTRNKISDYNGHGTNVAAQVSSRAFAFAGLTSQTTLIGVKVLGSNGAGTLGTVLSGVLWAADHGADVANMSLGGSFQKAGNHPVVKVIKAVFDYAAKSGTLIVVAAGNSASNLDKNGDVFAAYCDAPHVLCVSAVGPTTVNGDPDTPAFYSNFGKKSVDVAGPGGNLDPATLPITNWPWGPDFASWVWSFCSKTTLLFTDTGAPSFAGCQAGNIVTGFIGTSQATPHVTGLAALLVAENPGYKTHRIKQIVEDTGDRIPRAFGGNRINVAKALGIKVKKPRS
jgi:subtilisin family serine protease